MFLHPAIALAAGLKRLFCPVKKQDLYYQVAKNVKKCYVENANSFQLFYKFILLHRLRMK